jgi:hypothetical protein
MKSFFESMTWPRSRGRLHVYALANAPVAAMARAYHEVLADRGVTANLPRQPDEFLHVTIEQIQRYVDDMTADELGTLTAALTEHIGAVPAFDLTVGPIGVEHHAIGLDAVPDEPWQRLRQAVRAAAVEALGEDAVKPMHGPGAPHVSVSYATGEVDIMPHLRDLLRVRPGRATLPVDEVHLVAVEQDPAAGVYSWPGTVATFSLGSRS